MTVITSVLGTVLSLVMLVVVALQFVPAWELEGQSMSVAEYVWFPYERENQAFTKFFRTELEDALTSAGDIAGLALTFVNKKN